MNDTTVKMPAVYEDDGFNPIAPTDRIIIGTLLKFNAEGKWTEMGITFPASTRLLALAVTDVLQRWHDQRVIETITAKPLPDPEKLNKLIPENEWEVDVSGKPRKPWQHTWVIYLLNEATCEKYTYANSTVGTRIAVETLQDRVAWMRRLRGANIVPEVELGSRPFKTQYGMRPRPDFKIAGWRHLGGEPQAAPLPAPTAKPIERISEPVEPVSTQEELNDQIPW